MRYKLSVGSIFKNESFNIVEWLHHYINRGVEHFYLIDDNSDDDYKEKIQDFLDKGIITLYKNDVPKISGRQVISYNKFLTQIIQDSSWFIVCDLDEFLYSPKRLNLLETFNFYLDYNLLFVNWINFNSNNNIKHPNSIVESCIKRFGYHDEIYAPTPSGWARQTMESKKYIINSEISHVLSLGVHDCQIISKNGQVKTRETSYNGMSDDFDLAINHYTTQSKEYWEKNKMKRGDVNNWHSDDARNWDYFNALDIGEIKDTRLIEQNERHGIKYLK